MSASSKVQPQCSIRIPPCAVEHGRLPIDAILGICTGVCRSPTWRIRECVGFYSSPWLLALYRQELSCGSRTRLAGLPVNLPLMNALRPPTKLWRRPSGRRNPLRLALPREKADIKFENAFLAGEQCWDRYYRCTGNCRPAKGCIDACQSAFKQCFAGGERTMREGLREMKKFKFGSPDWKAAYAKGDKGTARCLTDILSCQGHCANP